jgi:toxin CptA
MHQAPAVSVHIGQSRSHGVTISIVWSLGWLAFLAYGLGHSSPALTIFFAVVLGGSGLLAWRSWYRPPAGVLRWDGQNWYWSGFGVTSPCHIVAALDLQIWMLVSAHTEAKGKVWLWLDASSVGMRWIPLRRAIVAYRRFKDHPAPSGSALDRP